MYKLIFLLTLAALCSCQKETPVVQRLSQQVVGNYLVTDTESFVHPITGQITSSQEQYGTHIYALDDTLVRFVNFYANNDAEVFEDVIRLPFLFNRRRDTLIFYRNTPDELSYRQVFDETKVIDNASYRVQVTLEGVLERR